MANYSDFELNLSGNPFRLRMAHDALNIEPYNFHIAAVNENGFYTDDNVSTWTLLGEGRWAVKIDSLVEFLEPYELSGTIKDSEPGSDFFVLIELENGVVVNSIDTAYISDEHYNYMSDNGYWYEHLSYALNEPDNYPEEIKFMLKHNIIMEDDLGQS